jgi:hypothetical protein
MAVFRAGLALFRLGHATSPVGAAETNFFCTDALTPSMRDLVPEFEKAGGHRVKIVVANAGTIALFPVLNSMLRLRHRVTR